MTGEAADAVAEARELLNIAWQGLWAGYLRHAAEDGWAAADDMAMATAVALARGWPYDTCGKFLEVMHNVAARLGTIALTCPLSWLTPLG